MRAEAGEGMRDPLPTPAVDAALIYLNNNELLCTA